MKKNKLIFYLITALLLTSCEDPEYEDDYFVYEDTGYYDDDMNYISKAYYIIVRLTEHGLQQKVLAIPETFNGKKIIIRSGKASEGYENISSSNLEKIFVPYCINEWVNSYFNCIKDNFKVITITYTPKQNSEQYGGDTYVSSYLYKNANKYLESIGYITKYNDIRKCHIANVSYHFNYEGAPNVGYYWLDDYDYGEQISYIPKDPIREGYIFSGWYKEKECINKWDFELDRLPNELLDEENEIVFQETMLYAKWI